MKTTLKTLFMAAVAAMLLFSCGGNKNEPAKSMEVLGAGATFPYPFYSAMFDKYSQTTGNKINYQSIGSGGGIQQLKNRTVDFGATDAPMSDKEMSECPAEIVHFPTCMGAVTITYNLPGDPTLKFTSDIIAGIFLGKIKKWNDPAIKELNPDVKLPNLDITPAHRSDGSGTTYIFSEYLTKTNDEWKEKVGTGKSLNWPVGLGGKGNEGVSGIIHQTQGAFGYVELIYALSNKMPQGEIKNKSGNFITPSLETVKNAADVDMPQDTRVSLTNSESANGYPIVSFTWLILYKEQNYSNRTEAQAKALLNLMWWVIHDGQAQAAPLFYAPLPSAAVAKAEARLKSVTFNGKPILQ